MLTADPAIQNSITSLEQTIDCLATYVLVCNAVIIVGLVVEYRHDAMDLITTRPFDRKLLQTIVGGILITLGIAGEFWLGLRASRAEQALRALNHTVVATLNAQAQAAQQDAAQANLKASQLQLDTTALAGKNAQLEGELKRTTAQAKKEEEQLKSQNLATEEKLEKERKTRLDLEAALSPRDIPYITYGSAEARTNIDNLKPFSGIPAVFEVIQDAEARRAARSVADLLDLAGWKISETSPRPELEDSFYDGVKILGPIPFVPPDPPDPLASKLSAACQALEKFLVSNGWKATCLHVRNSKLAPHPFTALRILVGFKPSPGDTMETQREQRKRDEFEKELENKFPRLPTPHN